MLASTAREHLADCGTVRRVLTDSGTGRTAAVVDAVSPKTGARGEVAADTGFRSRPAHSPIPPLSPEVGELLDRLLAAPMILPDLRSGNYRPSGRLVRFLEARDRTCVFPGCHRQGTDKDHRIPWPLGPTDPENLACLCRHHHRAKHTSFTLRRLPDGSYAWTSRSGHTWHRPP